MSKISETKALEAYPQKYDNLLDTNVHRRIGYRQGYEQAVQDFLEKAEKYLRKEFVDMWLRYIRGHSMEDEIKMFKKYIQDESEN